MPMILGRWKCRRLPTFVLYISLTSIMNVSGFCLLPRIHTSCCSSDIGNNSKIKVVSLLEGQNDSLNNRHVLFNAVSSTHSNSLSPLKNDTDFPLETAPISDILEQAWVPLRLNPETHMNTGLSIEQAQILLQKFGPNSLPPKKKKTLLQLFIQQFDDTLVRILLFVALLSLLSSSIPQILTALFSSSHAIESMDGMDILHNLLEPFVILLILALNATVGVWQTLRATTSLEALEKMQPKLATVLRRSHDTLDDTQGSSEWIVGIDASLLVPGDVIRIKAGDQVPADSRIWTLLSSSLSMDESSLTGESLPVYKSSEEEVSNRRGQQTTFIHPSNLCELHSNRIVYSGTMVITGSAIALVMKTGTNTEMGNIHNSVGTGDELKKTPLGEKLEELGEKLSRIIGIICLFVWLISIPHFSDPIFPSQFEAAIYYAKVAVALSIAAVPEGLAAIVTLTLSLGTRRMAEHNVVVRALSSVETLGCTTVICSDKTGTLTMNQQTVVSLMLFHGGKGEFMEHKVSGTSYSLQGDVENIDSSGKLIRNRFMI